MYLNIKKYVKKLVSGGINNIKAICMHSKGGVYLWH